MASNVTARVTRMSALVLGVAPGASTPDIVHRLQVLTGTGTDWLTAGSRAVPANPYQARAVQAARVLTAPSPAARSRAVVDFLAADYLLPETDRMAPPAPQMAASRGVQLAMVS